MNHAPKKQFARTGLLLLLQDLDHDPSNPTTRLYATHAAQPYHNDASDIVGKPMLKMPCRAPSTGQNTFVLTCSVALTDQSQIHSLASALGLFC